jgi:hypothetical protein
VILPIRQASLRSISMRQIGRVVAILASAARLPENADRKSRSGQKKNEGVKVWPRVSDFKLQG